MTARQSFRDEVRTLLHDRLLDAAYELTCARGWNNVRMADVAELTGVSRKTVYNEFGSRPALANALAIRNRDAYLAGMIAQADAHPDDIIGALVAASEHTLRRGADDPLLKAFISAEHGGGNELLPMLTTQSQPLITTVTQVIVAEVKSRWPHLGLTDTQLATAVASIVRLGMSHLLAPTQPPEQAARDIGWLATQILRPRATP